MESESKRMKTEDICPSTSDESNSEWGLNINDLPREILMQILRVYVGSEGVMELPRTISKVCVLWKHIADDSHLWSLLFKTKQMKPLVWHYENNELISADWLESFYTSQTYPEDVFTFCLEEKSVCYTDLHKGSIVEMYEQCQNIERLTLSRSPELLHPHTLIPLLEANGQNLIYIKLDCVYMPNALLVLKGIADFCPNLCELHIIHDKGYIPVFPLMDFQLKCPKLTVLELRKVVVHESWCPTNGFPELRSLTYTSHSLPVNNRMLRHIVKKSTKLQVLRLSWLQVTAGLLLKIPATDLEVLVISHTPVPSSPKFTDVLLKWKHSLRHVEIIHPFSRAKHIQNALMSMLSAVDEPILERLCLPCADVKFEFVIKIVKMCPRLQCIDLVGCRKLPIGIGHFLNTTNQIRKAFRKYI